MPLPAPPETRTSMRRSTLGLLSLSALLMLTGCSPEPSPQSQLPTPPPPQSSADVGGGSPAEILQPQGQEEYVAADDRENAPATLPRWLLFDHGTPFPHTLHTRSTPHAHKLSNTRIMGSVRPIPAARRRRRRRKEELPRRRRPMESPGAIGSPTITSASTTRRPTFGRAQRCPCPPNGRLETTQLAR